MVAFYRGGNDRASLFQIYLSQRPIAAFSVFARGYTMAAEHLTQHLLDKNHFSDYEAYPVVYLYRHALELRMKSVIYEAALLISLRNLEEFKVRLQNHHRLENLWRQMSQIMRTLWPKDVMVKSLLKVLKKICQDLSAIDPESFSFRYPVDWQGNTSKNEGTTISLYKFASHMSKVLEDLDTIDFALDGERYIAEENLRIMRDRWQPAF